jgi:archaetidylinositol phosphate synthase
MEKNKMADEHRGPDKKLPMTTLRARPEKKFIDYLTPKLPKYLETYHLTLMSVLWSAAIIFFGHLAAKQQNLHWLWLTSFMIFLQWFTDAFDGAVGRYKNTGLIKWGFYMDHLLDYVFLASIFIGYAFLLEGTPRLIVYLLIPVFGCFMVSSFLAFGATGEFKITYFKTGPTEIRIWFIVLNTVLICFGTTWIEKLLPCILGISIAVLCMVIFRTQKYIWKIDMKQKADRTG